MRKIQSLHFAILLKQWDHFVLSSIKGIALFQVILNMNYWIKLAVPIKNCNNKVTFIHYVCIFIWKISTSITTVDVPSDFREGRRGRPSLEVKTTDADFSDEHGKGTDFRLTGDWKSGVDVRLLYIFFIIFYCGMGDGKSGVCSGKSL